MSIKLKKTLILALLIGIPIGAIASGSTFFAFIYFSVYALLGSLVHIGYVIQLFEDIFEK